MASLLLSLDSGLALLPCNFIGDEMVRPSFAATVVVVVVVVTAAAIGRGMTMMPDFSAIDGDGLVVASKNPGASFDEFRLIPRLVRGVLNVLPLSTGLRE